MSPPARSYSSPTRQARAAETRGRLLEAAAGLLRERGGSAVSLEAVAAAAGVTRLTVYNQFGSRRGLLEAVFDARAVAAGLGRMAEVMSRPNARDALAGLVEIFCDFWGSDTALAGVQTAAAADPELTEALAARNERRREALAVLVRRMGQSVQGRRDDIVDLLFALTSLATYQALAARGRGPAEVCSLLTPLCDRVLAER